MNIDREIFAIGSEVRTASFRKRLLRVLTATAIVLCAFTSCIYDSYDSDDAGTSTSVISLQMRVASTGSSTGYEKGSTYENWLDISDDWDYRIYFFTNDPLKNGNDTFVAQFTPEELTVVPGTDYTWYSMSGPVPYALSLLTDFKVMVLANWGRYNYPVMTSETTIDDVCAFGTYSHKTEFVLDETNLIPFYGITEYKDIDFTAHKVTDLPDPINMVRAMAKVEVVLQSDLTFGSVVLHRYNETGYCAPSGVYTQDDYTTYDLYYVDDEFDLHLYNDGKNDDDTSGRALEMQYTLNDDGYDTWYCYVPEYRNTTDDGTASASDYAYIQVNLAGYEEDLEAYRIYFRNYSGGTASAGADYDIGRNVIYRFYVTMKEQWLNVHVDKWEDSYWNDFTFNGEDDTD